MEGNKKKKKNIEELITTRIQPNAAQVFTTGSKDTRGGVSRTETQHTNKQTNRGQYNTEENAE